MSRVIKVFDTETATLEGPVVDFAVVTIDEELNILSTVESLIDPQVPIAPSAQAIHHITDAMVADAPTMAEYIEHYGNPFAGADELIVIGHNVQFDCRMMADLLPETYTRVCTLKMARNMWPELDPKRESHKLEVLAIMFGLETGTAHRALGDTITCLNLLRHVADVSKVSSFEELLALGKRELSPESKLGFGSKHRDDKIKDVPISYIQWMLKNVTDLDPDLRAAITARLKK